MQSPHAFLFRDGFEGLGNTHTYLLRRMEVGARNQTYMILYGVLTKLA